MMKRIPLLIAVAAVSLSANAKQISSQQAEVIARKYAASPVIQKKLLSLEQQSTAPYYAFNSDKGFVVVSGDDSLTELVCYSDHGSIDTDNLPAPLKELLDGYANYVKDVQNGTAKAVRTETSADPTIIVSPMVTTKWNQDEPYNNMVPKDCATGCAATALAQVLNYHKWPDTGVGSNTYTDPTYGTMSMDFSKSTYDWGNMLDEYNEGEYNDAQANAVAKLMLDCGIALNMKYGPSSSASAYAYRKCGAFFKYEMKLLSRDDRSTVDNIALVTNELKSGRPFIIGAQSLEGGHAFVADGYDSNNFLHINWGWGGLSDAYFNLNYLDPDSQGIGGGSGAYSWDQDFIFMTPIRDGETIEGQPVLTYVTYLEGYGVNCSSTSFAKTEDAPFSLSKVCNDSSTDFAGSIAMGIFDNTNTLVARSEETADASEEDPFVAGAYITNALELPVDMSSLSDGIYTVRGIYRLAADASDETKWKRFESTSMLTATISGDNVTISQPSAKLNTAKATSISGNLGVGHILTFSLSLFNESPVTANGYIKYIVVKKSDGSVVTSGNLAAIIYDYSDYDTKVSVYLSPNKFEPSETYEFRIDGIVDKNGVAFNYNNDGGNIEFTTTSDEPRLQKQLTLVAASDSSDKTYEPKVTFTSDEFVKNDTKQALTFGPIANHNDEAFVGKIGYMLNKFRGETIYSDPTFSTSNSGMPAHAVCGYQNIGIGYTPLPSIKEDGIYSILLASVEKIDNAYPDEMVLFTNSEDYRLDFRVEGDNVTQIHPKKTVVQTAGTAIIGPAAIGETLTFGCQLENKDSEDVTGYVTISTIDEEGYAIDEIVSQAVTILGYGKANAEVICPLDPSKYIAGETYTVRVTEFHSEDDDYSFTVVDDYDNTFAPAVSGVEAVAAKAVKVYPNPAVDAIHTNTVAERIAVYSISGALVAEATDTDSLNVANLSSGCYIVAVTADGNTIRNRIVKK